MKSILFVCVGNICRSPMAAALVRERLGDHVAGVESAGIFGLSGERAASPAIEVARENGLEIDDHLARHVREIDLDRFDLLVALTPSIGRVLRDEYGVDEGRIVEMNVEDPYGADVDTYRRCFEEIESQIDLDSLR